MTRIGRSEDGGAAMVEFAILMPVLFLLVFGIIEFGRAYNAQNTLTHAAREGVREYAITQDPAKGETAAINAASTLDSNQIVVTTTACNPGQPTTLDLEYPFSMQIAFWNVANFTMEANGVMRCSG